jgi:hypothetical protein
MRREKRGGALERAREKGFLAFPGSKLSEKKFVTPGKVHDKVVTQAPRKFLGAREPWFPLQKSEGPSSSPRVLNPDAASLRARQVALS